MSDGKTPETRLDACGCCEGLERLTPVKIENAPGLSALAYRVGTHARFRASLQAELSRQSALAALTTRDDDDASLALLDAGAAMLDVLTFYQERIANEGYLRTATERRSLLELGRAIGYQLSPGVAANSYIAFTLEDAPGAPRTATVDAGTKVQSVPGPGEQPQTFETVEKIEARTEWNELRPLTQRPEVLRPGMSRIWLKGLDANLRAGDVLHLKGRNLAGNPFSEVRRVRTTVAEPGTNLTRLELDEHYYVDPTGQPFPHTGLYVFRVKAAPFGHNAPKKATVDPGTGVISYGEWGLAEPTDANLMALDGVFEQIQPFSYLLIGRPTSSPGYEHVMTFVSSLKTISRANYGISGRVTQLKVYGSWQPSGATDLGPIREMVVYAHPEPLALGEFPVEEPVYGEQIVLSGLASELKPGRAIAVSGKRLRVRVEEISGLELIPDDGAASVTLESGDHLFVLSPPELVVLGGADPVVLTPEELVELLKGGAVQSIRWRLMDRDGVIGTLTAQSNELTLQAADDEDFTVSEIVFIGDGANAISSDRDYTTITLKRPTLHCYDRATVTLNANVAAATHGEARREVLGSGDASRPFQSFTLKGTPLTYVQAATASGGLSTLEVRVGDVLWHEAPSLYNRGPKERIYVTRRGDDGKVTVQFGDGKTGARLPTGTENVVASYRVGVGTGGNVDAAQLTTLLSRPLGVRAASNPRPAEGGSDPESRDRARVNAPLTVRTLDRVVSLLDYEDFARSFTGVGKAQAMWLWNGHARVVHLTVAGDAGETLGSSSTVLGNLLKALQTYRDPLVQVQVDTYDPVTFQLVARLQVEADRETERVFAAVREALRDAYSFEARGFGQPVTRSEVLAVIQRVAGVVAVDLDALFSDPAAVDPNPVLLQAETARWNETTQQIEKAQLLTLSALESAVSISEMPS